ncbi:Citreoviridin biosynthesis protein D [Mycena indigotica]|uniref:Citreoviridin biosynthesis protein D n=1 Tax=Mycena indigotica TaxID=2126181 RepID=A0A8H6VWQ8_9AGAR|nr:Citreoviridin biosynthesis protein D [Mycena indigotica]KAF7294721.1 Citreoviridin biosynthesis protein D [Mycena indigotica]
MCDEEACDVTCGAPSSQKSMSLAFVVFPLLSALALKQTAGNAFLAGLGPIVQKQCPAMFLSAELTPYRIPYTHISAVDSTFCNFVAFFHLAFTPEVRPLLEYFFGTAFALLAIPAFEAARPGRHSSLALPVIYGLCMQLFTVAAVLPIYWLVFIFTGAHRREPQAGISMISAGHAQAIVFGLIIGVAVPSACLLVLQDATVTALWQLFPVWQYMAQSFHLLLRRPVPQESGFTWIQVLYAATFMLASSTHLAFVFGDNNLKAMFVPSFAPRIGAAPNLQVLDLLQWDMGLAFVSTLLATISFGKTTTQRFRILLWNIVSSFVVGPGAAIAAVALWRESQLHNIPTTN